MKYGYLRFAGARHINKVIADHWEGRTACDVKYMRASRIFRHLYVGDQASSENGEDAPEPTDMTKQLLRLEQEETETNKIRDLMLCMKSEDPFCKWLDSVVIDFYDRDRESLEWELNNITSDMLDVSKPPLKLVGQNIERGQGTRVYIGGLSADGGAGAPGITISTSNSARPSIYILTKSGSWRRTSWLVVFNVPLTARSFRDGTPIYSPLRRT